MIQLSIPEAAAGDAARAAAAAELPGSPRAPPQERLEGTLRLAGWSRRERQLLAGIEHLAEIYQTSGNIKRKKRRKREKRERRVVTLII